MKIRCKSSSMTANQYVTAVNGFKAGEHFYFYNLQFLTELLTLGLHPDILYQISGQLNESGCLFKNTRLLTLDQYRDWLAQLMKQIKKLPTAASAPKVFEQQLVTLRSQARQLGATQPTPASPDLDS